MNLEFTSLPVTELTTRVLLVLANKEGKSLQGSAELDAVIEPFVASGEFGSSFGGSVMVANPAGFQVPRLLFFNVGKDASKTNDLRKGCARSWKVLAGKGFDEVTFSLDGLDQDQARAALEGFWLSDFKYSLKTETENEPKRLTNMYIHSSDDHCAAVNSWSAIIAGTCRARELSQMPANLLTPIRLAELVQEWGPESGWDVSVLDEAQLKEEEMGAMLAIAQGSENKPRLIVMRYSPAQPSTKTVALIGKAVTFDSGGLNIKTASMEEMKGDMGGGAAVIGIMSALRQINYPHNVVGVIAAVENMPSGNAIRPSDVIKSKSGLTIEINNTDAEGRVILVDAITYARRFNPDFMVDFATLTGACLVALGPKIYGVMGNHQPLIDAIVKSGWKRDEPFWQLPLYDDYKELLKSQTADISNMPSTRYGGAITAGLFLERFTKDLKWAHCDIAAAIFERPDDYSTAGGNGAGVRTLLDVLTQIENLD